MHKRRATPSLIGSQEAAAILGVDRSTLNRMIRRGEVTPLTKLGDGRTAAWAFDRAQIEALAAERGAA